MVESRSTDHVAAELSHATLPDIGLNDAGNAGDVSSSLALLLCK